MCRTPRILWTAAVAVGLILNGLPVWAEGSNTESVLHGHGVQVAQMNSLYPTVLTRGVVSQTATKQSAETKKHEIRVVPGKKKDTWITYDAYFRLGHVGPEVEPVGEVVQGMRHHIAFSSGQFIFAEFETDENDHVNVKKGDQFRIIGDRETVRHPKTTFGITDDSEVKSLDFGYNGEFAYSIDFRTDEVGQKFVVKGVVEVVDIAPKGGVAKLKITQAFHPIYVKDGLIPMPREKPEMLKIKYQPEPKNIEAFLVGNDRTSSIFSTYGDEVYIDKGAMDNVAVGDRFEAYMVPEREDWFGDELIAHVIGELVVLSTQEHTATARVIEQTEALLPGQKVRSKR